MAAAMKSPGQIYKLGNREPGANSLTSLFQVEGLAPVE
jgi:hypothetical protein